MKKWFIPFEEVNTSEKLQIQLMTYVIIGVIWQFMVPLQGFMPSLSGTLSAMADLWMGGIVEHLLNTLVLIAVSTTATIIISSLIAYLSVVPICRTLIDIICNLRFNPISPIVMFVMILTGTGRMTQYTLLVLFMSFFFITSMVKMIQTIPREDYYAWRSMKMGPWEILYRMVIKDRACELIDTIRQTLPISLGMIISVEGMNKMAGGLGALLMDSTRALRFDKIIALEIIILCIGIISNYILRRWYYSFPQNKNLKNNG